MSLIITPLTNANTLDGYHASNFAFSNHSHGNITNDGKIGTLAGNVAITTTGGSLTVLAQGTTSEFLRGDGTWEIPSGKTYTAGNGLSLNGTTFALNTPSNLSTTTYNAVTANSHTHYIVTTNSGTADTIVATGALGNVSLGNVTSGSFIKSGGTSSQFLKADGTVDSNTYSTTTHNHNGTYEPAVTKGNIASNTTTVLGVTNGTGATFTNVYLTLNQATTSQNGYLSSTDWNTFNNKTSNMGTVTSVATDNGAILGGTITTSGTISHNAGTGYKHLPSGGASANFLKWSSDGTGTWREHGLTNTDVGAAATVHTHGNVNAAGYLGTVSGNVAVTTTNGLLAPLVQGTTSQFLRGDGTWATPSGGTGTVTSVGGTGIVSGLTLTGTVTNSGNLTLGGSLVVTPSNFLSQSATTFLAAPVTTAGNPSFRFIQKTDIPTLNQDTTGKAGSVANSLTINNSGTGAASGSTYNGSTALTVSYNTIGAQVAGTYVTSVSGTAPVSSSGGTTPAISMAAATSTVNGYMTSTYAAKLDGIAAGATANTGTVTSVTGGTGLSGGAITTTGTLAVIYGTAVNTACQGNDSRLSDARTPVAHTQAESTITFTDITNGNATTGTHGFLPKLGGGTTNYLRADGTWATPAGGTGLTAGSASTGFINYAGLTNVAGQWDGSTNTPTGTIRLNYSGYLYPTYINLTGSADTATAASHYFVETGSDGYVRPKTLDNVKAELVVASEVLTKLLTVDGAGSGLDADTLDEYHLASADSNGKVWGYIPRIHTDGVMEIGKYIDFHNASNDGIDFFTRVYAEAAGQLRIQNASGYVDIGPQNTSNCHIYTDRPNFYINKPMYFDGNGGGAAIVIKAGGDLMIYNPSETQYSLIYSENGMLNVTGTTGLKSNIFVTTNYGTGLPGPSFTGEMFIVV